MRRPGFSENNLRHGFLRPSGEFRAALSVLQDRFREAGVSGRWLNPSGFHMTLAFVGEWPEDISPFLPAVDPPFSVTLSRIGVFRESKVLWAAPEPSEELGSLAEKVRSSLTENGIPFDPKEFSPHITLARKPSFPSGFIPSGIVVLSVSMRVDKVCLYRSDRGEQGMEYTVIGTGPGESGE